MPFNEVFERSYIILIARPKQVMLSFIFKIVPGKLDHLLIIRDT